MDNKIEQKIPEQLSIYIERLYFEYKANLQIIKYMINNHLDNNPIIQDYIKKAEQKNIELEIAKQEIINEYLPQNSETIYQYKFNFENSSFEYWEKKE